MITSRQCSVLFAIASLLCTYTLNAAGIQMAEHPAFVACLDNPPSCNELFLSNKRLEGNIPASIGLLTNLTVL